MRDQIFRLGERLDSAKAANEILREKLARAERANKDQFQQLVSLTRETIGQENEAQSNQRHTWRYEYEYGLISNSGKGRLSLRYRDGSKTTIRYSYENYATDEMFFSGMFRNTSKTTARFQFRVNLAKPTINMGGGAQFEVVGRKLCKTPYLEPGEIYDFNTIVRVSTIREVSSGGIDHVQAFELE
jgi:hypothetical protein